MSLSRPSRFLQSGLRMKIGDVLKISKDFLMRVDDLLNSRLDLLRLLKAEQDLFNVRTLYWFNPLMITDDNSEALSNLFKACLLLKTFSLNHTSCLNFQPNLYLLLKWMIQMMLLCVC